MSRAHKAYQHEVVDNIYDIVPSKITVRTETDDDRRYSCTCTADDIGDAHPMHCDVRNHSGWMDAICEWDPDLAGFLYFVKANIPVGVNTIVSKPATNMSAGWTDWYSKCRHYEVPVEFPDGTVIYASSMNDTKRDDVPHFGVYLCSWRPSWPHILLPWQDYGLPQIPRTQVLGIVEEMLELARAGMVVETGCMGGHGRTGTMLALIATHCGIDAEDAVHWVRMNYCHHAIEGAEQEHYVREYDALRHGRIPPAPPVKPPPAPKTNTSKPSGSTSSNVAATGKPSGPQLALGTYYYS